MDDFNVVIMCDTTRALKSKIFIDNNEVGKIGHNETVPLLLPRGKHSIFFKNFGSKTKSFEFEVSENKIGIKLQMVFRTIISSFILSDLEIKKIMTGNNLLSKEVKAVKILGTRTGMETRILGTYNFTIYSMLILYDNGEKEVIECDSNSDRFKELIQHVDIDATSTGTSIESIDKK